MFCFRSVCSLWLVMLVSCSVTEKYDKQDAGHVEDVVSAEPAVETGEIEYSPRLTRLSAIIRNTGRALTLEVAGLEWVRPNDHVDIIAILPDPVTGKPTTVTLIQNVIVLAVGSQTGDTALRTPDPQDPNAGKATFMLLPEEVERLVMAAGMGKLTVSLRNPEDLSATEAYRAVLVDDLFGRDQAKMPPGKTK